MKERIGKTFEESVDKFVQQVDTVRERATALQQRADQTPWQQQGNTPEALEELQTAIAELHVAQEELQAQNEELANARAKVEAESQRYHDLFEFAPDGYLVTDDAGKIREANRAAATLLNVSQRFVIGKPLINYIPQSERPAFRSQLNRLRQVERLQEWEVHLCPRTSAPFDAALSVTNVRDYKGKTVALRWLVRDITERKQAESALRRAQVVEAANLALEKEIMERQQLEAALRQSKERYRAISELTSDYTYAYRIEPNGTLVPELLNEAFTRTCGYTIEEIAVRGWQSLVHFEDMPIVFRHIQQLLSGQPDVCEHRILTKSSDVRWVRNYARPTLDVAQGCVLRIYGAAQDITERKRAEKEREQLLEREQAARTSAEAANRMKDEFLAIVSHELRSPLNAILGWAKLLRTRQFNEETIARALETIERNAQLQTNLIEDRLDISRIIRGKLRLQLRPVNLVPVIEAAINTVQPAADAKAIQLESVLDSDIGSVSGDTDRLQQVIWNLLSNAIKFTPKGGRVEVRLERIHSHVEITVTDTGIGINPDFLPHIFDRFRQADSTSTRSYGGLGLGLAIIRHLVELHGGTVRAESKGEGQGATFTVKLPLPAVRLEASVGVQVSEPVGRGVQFNCDSGLSDLRVLVVDDEADARELIATVLEQCGARVTATASAREALQALERFKPDVLVSDIGMPGEDGYALIRQLRALEASRGGRLPAVALTAFAREEDRQQAILAGFQTHLSKPVEPAKLVAVVANLAGHTGI